MRRAIEPPTQRGAATNDIPSNRLLRVYRVLLELHIDPVWIDDVETGSALFIDRLDPLRS